MKIALLGGVIVGLALFFSAPRPIAAQIRTLQNTYKGISGPKGDRGDQGPKGDKGDVGPAGATGPAGPAGAVGPVGPKGDAGAPGANGKDGAAGPKGDQGEVGPTGIPGSVGPAGPAGPKGDPGIAGTAGKDGASGMTTATQFIITPPDAGYQITGGAPPVLVAGFTLQPAGASYYAPVGYVLSGTVDLQPMGSISAQQYSCSLSAANVSYAADVVVDVTPIIAGNQARLYLGGVLRNAYGPVRLSLWCWSDGPARLMRGQFTILQVDNLLPGVSVIAGN